MSLTLQIENLIIPSREGLCSVFSIQPRNLGVISIAWEEERKEKKVTLSRFLILSQLEKDGKILQKAQDEIYFELKENELRQTPFVYWSNELREGRYKLRVVIKDKIRGILQSEDENIEISQGVLKDEGIERFFFVNESNLIRSLDEKSCLPEIGGRRLYPRTSNEFSRNEMLSLFFEYISREPKGEAQLIIDIFKDDQLIKSIKERFPIDAKKLPIYRSIPLSEFSPGEYILEVEIIHPETGVEYKEKTNFKVVD